MLKSTVYTFGADFLPVAEFETVTCYNNKQEVKYDSKLYHHRL